MTYNGSRTSSNGQSRQPTALPTVFMVRIRALTNKFQVDGKPAEPGAVYTVAKDIAEGLAHFGKARIMGWDES